MNKLEDIAKEIESRSYVIEYVAQRDLMVNDFMRSYNYIIGALEQGIHISEFIEDQVVTRWKSVVKNRVDLWIH